MVNLYKLHFPSSYFSFQPYKIVFQPFIFPSLQIDHWVDFRGMKKGYWGFWLGGLQEGKLVVTECFLSISTKIFY